MKQVNNPHTTLTQEQKEKNNKNGRTCQAGIPFFPFLASFTFVSSQYSPPPSLLLVLGRDLRNQPAAIYVLIKRLEIFSWGGWSVWVWRIRKELLRVIFRCIQWKKGDI